MSEQREQRDLEALAGDLELVDVDVRAGYGALRVGQVKYGL